METWLQAANRVDSIRDDRELPARSLLFKMDKTRLFLIHSRLMDDLRSWANSQGADRIDLIDLIQVLDGHRHHMLSWVHLHPDANRMIADALAAKILAACCEASE